MRGAGARPLPAHASATGRRNGASVLNGQPEPTTSIERTDFRAPDGPEHAPDRGDHRNRGRPARGLPWNCSTLRSRRAMLPRNLTCVSKGSVIQVRILFVEDSQDDVELLLARVRSAGLAPQWLRVASEGELREALASSEWQVALVDYDLPGFSGLEALRILADAAPDLPAITVSGTISEETAVATITAGAVDFVLKDNLTRLAPAVKRAVESAELRRAQRDAAEQARQSQFAVDHASQAIVYVSEDGRHPVCQRGRRSSRRHRSRGGDRRGDLGLVPTPQPRGLVRALARGDAGARRRRRCPAQAGRWQRARGLDHARPHGARRGRVRDRLRPRRHREQARAGRPALHAVRRRARRRLRLLDGGGGGFQVRQSGCL